MQLRWVRPIGSPALTQIPPQPCGACGTVSLQPGNHRGPPPGRPPQLLLGMCPDWDLNPGPTSGSTGRGRCGAPGILKPQGDAGAEGFPSSRDSGRGLVQKAFAGYELWSILATMLALTSFLQIPMRSLWGKTWSRQQGLGRELVQGRLQGEGEGPRLPYQVPWSTTEMSLPFPWRTER